jgi:hypothetical protein
MPNPMIDPSTGRVMNAYTLLRRKGPNANIARTRVSLNTTANQDRKVSGQGVGGMVKANEPDTTIKDIGGF